MTAFAWEQIFPDETLCSFLSRQVMASGCPSCRVAQQSLWGNHNLQLNTNFPSLIPWISDNFGIHPVELLDNHTCLNYFKPYLGQSKYELVKQALLTGDVEFVQKWLGITSNRVKESGSLYYCPECVNDDLEQYGVAYWHRTHQLHGLITCPAHAQQLLEVKVTRREVALPPQRHNEIGHQDGLLHNHFSSFSLWALLQTDIDMFDYEQLTNCYRIELFNKEFACKSLRIRQKCLREDLQGYYAAELNHAAWQALFSTNKTYPYPCQLFYNYHDCHFHPAKHLALMAYLFSTPESFLSKYHSANKDLESHFNSNASIRDHKNDTLKSKLILSLFSQGKSLRNIAKQVKLSVTAVKSKVVAGGGKVKSRASKIFENDRRAILRKLMMGTPTKDIAKGLNLSTGAIEQVLTQHPELVEQRKHFRFRAKLVHHRKSLSLAMKKFPRYTRNQLKNKFNASYMWLFKHDKNWLYRHLPTRKQYKKPEK
ncbi:MULTISPECIES: TnsD family Tn7-like transposition protein [unclassified Pseudoalteromonas]|uniref:TnsD family Tn7-like transposition protein n=1 Tax=unclassified Pseudoalteromonas TaxID=194690 RepID=UPI0025B77168|nr:TnsD family Tn7-like transposition protein [Pseudoalteromonas sp. CnMc7-37]